MTRTGSFKLRGQTVSINIFFIIVKTEIEYYSVDISEIAGDINIAYKTTQYLLVNVLNMKLVNARLLQRN